MHFLLLDSHGRSQTAGTHYVAPACMFVVCAGVSAGREWDLLLGRETPQSLLQYRNSDRRRTEFAWAALNAHETLTEKLDHHSDVIFFAIGPYLASPSCFLHHGMEG
jgi:hypothetical protein